MACLQPFPRLGHLTVTDEELPDAGGGAMMKLKTPTLFVWVALIAGAAIAGE